jgi:hypothetical protein
MTRDVLSKRFISQSIGFGEWILCEDGKTRLEISESTCLNFELWLVNLPPELVPVAKEAITRSLKRFNAMDFSGSLQNVKEYMVNQLHKELLKMRTSGEFFKFAAKPEYLVH